MNTITVEKKEKFEISPYLYMQFFEPLGATDTSADAAWDYMEASWRSDVLASIRELAPSMLRFGGCFSSYYKWKEAVGKTRIPMHNLCWGGMESNQIGTHEFLNLCRKVNAEALININFESDGRRNWASPKVGGDRSGTAEEAAEWVDYCNNPDSVMRINNGVKEPYGVKYWQIGNETSYDKNGFDCETAVRKTAQFAKQMKKADPNIKLIAWGDSGWAQHMLEENGSELDYIAFHHHFNSGIKESKIDEDIFIKEPAQAWEHLMNAWKSTEELLCVIREEIEGNAISLAMTESHFALSGSNRGDILSTWASAVANARILNVHERHGDILKIATLADFMGNRWQVNAIMIPTPNSPHKSAYLMPVARVMKMFGRNTGRFSVDVKSTSPYLDITASKTENTYYLHIVNTSYDKPVSVQIRCGDTPVNKGTLIQASFDKYTRIMETRPMIFNETTIENTDLDSVTFPAGSVNVICFETE